MGRVATLRGSASRQYTPSLVQIAEHASLVQIMGAAKRASLEHGSARRASLALERPTRRTRAAVCVARTSAWRIFEGTRTDVLGDLRRPNTPVEDHGRRIGIIIGLCLGGGGGGGG